jgi:hypothetical protein
MASYFRASKKYSLQKVRAFIREFGANTREFHAFTREFHAR